MYTPATKLPSLTYAQWCQPNAPNPRIDLPVAANIGTIAFTAPLLDHNGNIVTGGCLIGIRDSVTSYVEHIYAPPGAFSANGLVGTGLVRGIRLEGQDFTTSDPTKSIDLGPDSSVFLEVDPVLFNLMILAMQGSIASGGTSWRIGDFTNVDISVKAANGDVNEPFFRYSAAANQWVFSNDGTSSTPFGTGAGVTGGSGISVIAGVISVNLSDTTDFVTISSGASDSGKVARLNASGQFNSGFINAIPASSYAAKGDVLVGTAAGTFSALTIGANGTVLQADSTQTTGAKWGSIPLTSGNFANGKTTRPNDNASGTLVIPHGLGTTPTSILTQAVTISASAITSSSGAWKTGSENCVGNVTNLSTTLAYTTNGSTSIYVELSVGNNQKATITADATNITYNFIKTGTGAGAGANIEILWQAFA